MAIINCPECSSKVSDSAFKCPSCGVQLRKPKRSILGKIFKYGFIVFNLFMALWLFGAVGAASEGMETMSGAERAGAALGTGLGAAVVVGMWVFGDIILGLFVLFTRPKE